MGKRLIGKGMYAGRFYFVKVFETVSGTGKAIRNAQVRRATEQQYNSGIKLTPGYDGQKDVTEYFIRAAAQRSQAKDYLAKKNAEGESRVKHMKDGKITTLGKKGPTMPRKVIVVFLIIIAVLVAIILLK